MIARHFTVPMAARMYHVPLVDYCESTPEPNRWGVLIGSGCGLMMSVMDVVPFRFCLDADELHLAADPSRAYALAQFIAIAARLEGVALVGWFSITDPAPLANAFAALDPPGLLYMGDMQGRRPDVPGTVDTLEQFLTAARARWNPRA